MPVRYADCVWTEGRLNARGYKTLVKPRDVIWCDLVRGRQRDDSPLAVIRAVPEELIMRGHDGLGDSGADFFPVTNPKTGRYYCVGNGRGTGGPNVSQKAILAPGPDGPIATERFESFREGMEICEAIIFLQRALEENKISGALKQKVNRYLDERDEAFLRHWSARQLERDEQVFALAAEVAAAMRKGGAGE